MSMGGPEKPETPLSEKIKTQVSAQMFKEGTAIKSRVGKDYVKDVTRKTAGREAASANLENEKDKSERPKGRKATEIAAASLSGGISGIGGAIEGGVTDSQRTTSSANFATGTARNLVNTLDIASGIDHAKSMDKFDGKVERQQAMLDVAGTAAGYGLTQKWDNEALDTEHARMDEYQSKPQTRGGKRRKKKTAGIGG